MRARAYRRFGSVADVTVGTAHTPCRAGSGRRIVWFGVDVTAGTACASCLASSGERTVRFWGRWHNRGCPCTVPCRFGQQTVRFEGDGTARTAHAPCCTGMALPKLPTHPTVLAWTNRQSGSWLLARPKQHLPPFYACSGRGTGWFGTPGMARTAATAPSRALGLFGAGGTVLASAKAAWGEWHGQIAILRENGRTVQAEHPPCAHGAQVLRVHPQK